MIFLSKNETLHINEEIEYIDEINNYLSIFKNSLESNFNEKSIIINGSFICELMIELIMKKERINPDTSLLQFCSENYLIPEECSDFLSIITEYKNSISQSQELTDSTIPFLKAFSYFIIWFEGYYKTKYFNIKKFKIEECYNTIFNIIIQKEKICPNCGFKIMEDDNFCTECGTSLKEHEIPKIKFKSFKNEKLNNIGSDDYIDISPQDINSLMKNESILEKLGEQTSLLIEILKQLNRIENKIDYIVNEITTLQKYTEKLIENVNTDSEIDMIIKTYTDQCIENIMKKYIKISEDQNYDLEKRKLIYSIGENAWNKLSEQSQTFLITSKIMFNKLILMDEIIDYSGICILITKALEVEMTKRFFTNFIKYLDKTYKKDYSKYPTALLFNKKKPLFKNKVSLGNFQFILCLKENRYDTPEESKNNKEKLLEYCKNSVFSINDENKIEDAINYYANSIEEIRLKYRNPSAHTNEIKRVDAEECFKLVLDVEKLLKKMLDSFNY